MKNRESTARALQSGLLATIQLLNCGLFVALYATAAHAFATPTFVRAWGGAGSGNGQFSAPVAIATGPSGGVYVGDTSSRRVQEFDSAGTFVLAWGAAGPPSGSLMSITGLAVAPSGNVYVADLASGHVYGFTSSGTYASTIGSPAGFGGPVGTFYPGPTDVACSPAGDIYATDQGNNRVEEFDASGTFIRAFGQTGSGDGLFDVLMGICVSPDGTVFVSDRGSNCVQAFTSSGSFLRRWGSTGSGPGQFSKPLGLACDSNGNVYVADSENNRVQVFTSEGVYLGQWNSGAPVNGQFDLPNDVAIFGSTIYVMDTGWDRVQEFTLAPVAAKPTSWGKVKDTYH